MHVHVAMTISSMKNIKPRRDRAIWMILPSASLRSAELDALFHHGHGHKRVQLDERHQHQKLALLASAVFRDCTAPSAGL